MDTYPLCCFLLLYIADYDGLNNRHGRDRESSNFSQSSGPGNQFVYLSIESNKPTLPVIRRTKDETSGCVGMSTPGYIHGHKYSVYEHKKTTSRVHHKRLYSYKPTLDGYRNTNWAYTYTEPDMVFAVT